MEGSDSMKGIFDYVHLLYYKCHKINPNRSGSYIDSPDWLKNKKATINPINRAFNKGEGTGGHDPPLSLKLYFPRDVFLEIRLCVILQGIQNFFSPGTPKFLSRALINQKDYKCFQYTVTVALNYEEVKKICKEKQKLNLLQINITGNK